MPRQLLAVIISSTAAIAANVLLYLILKDIFGVEFIAPEGNQPLAVSPLPVTDVILFSGIFSVGASLVFLVVANTAQKPAQVFTAISLVVLLASCLLPLLIPTPPIPMATKLSLMSMHVLGAAVLVPLMIRIGLPANSARVILNPRHTSVKPRNLPPQ